MFLDRHHCTLLARPGKECPQPGSDADRNRPLRGARLGELSHQPQVSGSCDQQVFLQEQFPVALPGKVERHDRPERNQIACPLRVQGGSDSQKGQGFFCQRRISPPPARVVRIRLSSLSLPRPCSKWDNGPHNNQKFSFKPNWIWREVVLVLVKVPLVGFKAPVPVKAAAFPKAVKFV